MDPQQDYSIDELNAYLKTVGFDNIRWRGEPIELVFTDNTLHIELSDSGIWLGVCKKIDYQDRLSIFESLSQSVHFDQHLPVAIKAGLMNNDDVFLNYTLPWHAITLDKIHAVVDLMQTLINKSFDLPWVILPA